MIEYVPSAFTDAVLARRRRDSTSERTAKLLAAGRNKMAQKVGEEAVEVASTPARETVSAGGRLRECRSHLSTSSSVGRNGF